MRGKVLENVETIKSDRITPAYAGKSADRRAEQDVHQDHPRLCGEKHASVFLASSTAGSPPPMRGKVHFLVELPQPFRITPAYAGKSRAYKGMERA